MEDKNSSSILKSPLNKGLFKEIWKMEEKIEKFFSILFTDMAKLVFAGVILGGVFEKVETPIYKKVIWAWLENPSHT